MSTARCWIATLIVLLYGSAAAQAHFLFVRILPAAEGGRHAEVYFSELAEAGDVRFIAKIAHTKLWLQSKPGAFQPLAVHKTADRLRTLVPSNGTIAVIGECTYGVLGKQTPFLLRHYPRAIAGRPEEINALQRKPEIPFEIQVRAEGKGLEFTALRNGKPVPEAVFNAVAVDLKTHKFTAGADGKATWQPANPGNFSVYTSQTLKEAGIHEGSKYEEIREFATLAFSWPLFPQGADADAVKLFQDAMAARSSWHDFPGFSAHIKAHADGRTWEGTATISAKGEVDLSGEDELVSPWVKEQLESMVLHRIARSQGKPPVLRFADNDKEHPMGRLLVFEGGKFASSYRVKDRQILVVNRSLGGTTNMTITVLDNDQTAEKKFLPRSYTVQYWDAVAGKLQRTETIQNRWTRLGSWDLPTQLTVLTSSEVGQEAKTMSLTQIRLLSADMTRFVLAQKGYNSVAGRFGEVMRLRERNILTVMPDEVYKWSVRVLQAERDLFPRQEDQVAALEGHLRRMRELEKKVGHLGPENLPQPALLEAQLHCVEAEGWLAKAKAKK